MDAVPSEVLYEIFKLACTDGGFTGASLSRTSKAMRTASASQRFHSLKLTSLAHIEKCLTCFSNAPAHATRLGDSPPRIRHLFLSFPFENLDWSGVQWFLCSRLMNREKRENHPYAAPVTRLIELAPELETLMVFGVDVAEVPFLRLYSPLLQLRALRELTLFNAEAMFIRPWKAFGNSSMPPGYVKDLSYFTGGSLPLFPSLQRLHTVDYHMVVEWWNHRLSVWANMAPGITHLRISTNHSSIVQGLHDVIAAQEPLRVTNEAERPAPLLHRGLCNVICQSDLVSRSGNDRHSTFRIVDDACASRNDFRVLLVPAVQGKKSGYWRDRLLREWLERMDGGRGCWVRTEEEERALW